MTDNHNLSIRYSPREGISIQLIRFIRFDVCFTKSLQEIEGLGVNFTGWDKTIRNIRT